MRGIRSPRATLLVLALVVCACGTAAEVELAPSPAPMLADDAVTVGSFDFGESELLAELYAVALERAGFRVEREFRIGPRELVEPALERGLIELLPEYAGSALDFAVGRQAATADVNATHGALGEAMRSRGLTVLEASSAQDQNGSAVTRATAGRLGLRTLSDLATLAEGMRFGGPSECAERPLCLLGLREVYGLEFEDFVPLDAAGPLTVAALRGGEVDVALVFTTDPALLEGDILLLADDRGLQPAENVTPVVHEAALQRFGQALTDAVNAVSRRLTTEELRRMNGQVQAGRSLREIAADWLDRHLPDDPG